MLETNEAINTFVNYDHTDDDKTAFNIIEMVA